MDLVVIKQSSQGKQQGLEVKAFVVNIFVPELIKQRNLYCTLNLCIVFETSIIELGDNVMQRMSVSRFRN